MKLKKEYTLLIAIFLVVLGIRLYFAFQTPYFSESAYFNLRQVEHIKQTGAPIYEDDLSYGGRTYVFTPLFHYTLAFFSLFLPLAFVAKLLPNLFAATLVFIIYLIAKEITKSADSALFAALMAGFIPIFFSSTINSVSIYSLVIPLNFLVIYFFLTVNQNKRHTIYLVVVFFLLILSHPASFILIIGFLFYLLIAKIEEAGIDNGEIEVILFFTALVVWFNMIIYKNAFLMHGPSLIWRNIPPQVQNLYFAKTSIAEAIYQIGVIPFLFGVYVIYSYFYKYRKKNIYLLISFVLTAFLLLAFKLIEPIPGLIFLGTFLVLLFSQFYKNFILQIEKTHIARFKKHIVLVIAIIFILTSIVPSITYSQKMVRDSVNSGEIEALEWLKGNTEAGSIVLATPEQGHLVAAIANRKNVIDDNFLLVKDAKQRYEDVRNIYTTHYETNAVQLLNKYNVGYIYFSDSAKQEFSISKLSYVDDTKCFKNVYDKEVKIYQTLCRVEERV